MQAYLDDKPLVVPETADTVAAVVEQARVHAAHQDRVIVGILCDGRNVAEENLEAALASPAGDYDEIALSSGKPAQLVRDAVTQASVLLEETNEGRAQVVDALTRGDTVAANGALANCFSAWSQIHQTIAQALSFLQVDATTFPVEGRPLDTYLEGVADQLARTRDAITAGDTVTLSDVMQYEFDATADKWRSVLNALDAHAEQALG